MEPLRYGIFGSGRRSRLRFDNLGLNYSLEIERFDTSRSTLLRPNDELLCLPVFRSSKRWESSFHFRPFLSVRRLKTTACDCFQSAAREPTAIEHTQSWKSVVHRSRQSACRSRQGSERPQIPTHGPEKLAQFARRLARIAAHAFERTAILLCITVLPLRNWKPWGDLTVRTKNAMRDLAKERAGSVSGRLRLQFWDGKNEAIKAGC